MLDLRPQLQPRLQQRMHLSQQMLQNLELLQLPVMDLRELVMEELQENPALEEKQDFEESEPDPAVDAPEETPEETAKREILESVAEQWADSERRTRRSDGVEFAERRAEMFNNVSAPVTSLRDHLGKQLALLDQPAPDRAFCEYVIQNVDENGYLSVSVEDMAASLPEELRGETPEALARRIEHAVTVVQSFEPRGVAARNLRECLLLQLDERDPCRAILRVLVETHLEDIGANRLPKIAKALESDPRAEEWLGYRPAEGPERLMEDVKALVGAIQRLNPKPGLSRSAERPVRVYPEVLIRQIEGRYEVFLEDGWLPPIALNPSYAAMAKDRDVPKDQRQYLRSKLEAGRKLITAIEQRRRTIYRITTELLESQMDFFENGIEHLKPLKMQEVADAVGIHLSTVSRAISGKWVETPRGIFPLKFFFASLAPATRPGEAGSEPERADETRVGLMEKIRVIVGEEDKANPLSDLDIVRRLRTRFGIDTARRTVAKYREEIAVPPSSLRKVF